MSPDASRDGVDETPPPYRAAVAAASGALLLYLLTLAPTTGFWDASEYIATAHTLGIPHPPGNPLFVVLGRTWSVLLSVLALPVAVRINLLAAATSAAATGFFYLVAHRIVRGLTGRHGVALAGAGAAALLAATAFTVWSQSTVNEKVYTISVLIIAAVTWLTLRWRDVRHRPGSERLLLWAVFLMALGSTNHLMSVLPLPAFALTVLVSRPGLLLRRGFLARAVILGVVGLSFNFVLPIRAAQDPVINEGDPTCPSLTSAAVAIYTFGRAGCPALADNLTRRQYQPVPVTQRKAPFRAQMAMYLQYFDWQWARGADPSPLPGNARGPFTLFFFLLGLVGLYTVFRVDRVAFLYLGVLALTLTVGLVYYLNFRYGFSLAPEITDRSLHEVRERDYFFIAGFHLWGVLAGVGLAWVWHTVSSIRRSGPAYRVASPVLVAALFPLVLNWSWASRAGDWAPRDWAYDLLMSVEPYAVLFTNGDNDTFPLWYLQEVEGIRRDVTVIVGQYLFTRWYPKQLQDLTRPGRQRPYEPERGGAPYPPVPPPAEPIVDLTGEQLDRIGTSVLEEDLAVPLPGLVVRYPAGTRIDRAQALALSIIHDAIDERPVYFASSAGMIRELGLSRWGVRHGLTVKLEIRPLDEPLRDGWVQGSPEYGGEWFDLPRSLRLYDEIYLYRGLKDRAIWPDLATSVIPWQFYALAVQLADVVERSGGDGALVERLRTDAAAFQMVAEGGLRGRSRVP